MVRIDNSNKFVSRGAPLLEKVVVFIQKVSNGEAQLIFSLGETIQPVVLDVKLEFVGTSDDFFNWINKLETWSTTGNVYIDLNSRIPQLGQRMFVLGKLPEHQRFFKEG